MRMAIVIAVLLTIMASAFGDVYADKAQQFVNPFKVQGNWYKANLHAHTTVSDGDVNVATRISQYRDKGYNVLAITDHWKTSDLGKFSTKEMLIVPGAELNEKIRSMVPYHLVALNVPADFSISENSTPQEKIKAVKALGGEVLYAHPYWSGLTINDYPGVEGCCAVEVYNGGCQSNNKAFSQVHWDDILSARNKLPAVAVDDVHSGSEVGRGWIMIKASELSTAAVMSALRTGNWYSSAGPVLVDFNVDDNRTAYVKCSPVKEIHFVSQSWFGESVFAPEGKLISEARVKLHKDSPYVRVEVVDIQNKRAWSNPIYLKK